MCITFFYFPSDPATQTMFIAFNRDESSLRLTDDLHRWPDDPNLIAATDTVLKGTWFGINAKTQNIAFLTNLEDPLVGSEFKFNMRSRGDLIRNFLRSDFYERHSFDAYLDQIIEHCAEYNPFNPVFGNLKLNKFYYIDIVHCVKKELPKDTLLGFSNNLAFCHSWPKVERGLELMGKLGPVTIEKAEGLMEVMRDKENFGISDPNEESSIFIEPYVNEEKLKIIATVSTSLLFACDKKASFLEYRRNLDDLDRVKTFMLGRKAGKRLKNYVRFVMFMRKESSFRSVEHLTSIAFDLE
jgi:uncharacterized protein with NRDE domain